MRTYSAFKGCTKATKRSIAGFLGVRVPLKDAQKRLQELF